MAMRPPVPVPTLSRRAKLVLGAVAVLLVLFTAIGTLTNVYVDYLWFDETGYTEVFWTELQTRALLFAVAGVATGGLVATAIYLAYRFRPTFRPMSLEQQNLERYRQSLEPRRGLVLTAVGVVLGLFAGFTAQGSWQTWLQFRNSTEFGRTDPQFGIDLSFFVFDYPFYRLALGFGFAIVLLALIGSLLTHYVFGGPPAADARAEADRGGARPAVGAARACSCAEGGRLLAGPLRPGLLRPRRGLHRRQLHRRERAAGAQDDPGVRRRGLRDRVLRQHLRPQLPAAGRRAGAAADLQPGHRGGLPGDRPAVRGQAERQREGGALHRAGHRLHARRPTASTTSTTSTTPSSTGRRGRHRGGPRRAAQRHRDHPERPAARPERAPATFTAASRSATSTASPEKLDIDRYTIRRREATRLRGGRRASSTAPAVGEPGHLDQPAHRLHARQRLRRRAGERGRRRPGGRRAQLHDHGPADRRRHRRRAAAHLLRRADPAGQDLLRRRRAGRARPREFDQPEDGSTRGRSTTPTTARAGCRSAASSAS